MFYFIITHFIKNYHLTPLRLMDYVTFRAGAAFLTAMIIGLVLGPYAVRMLKELRAAAPARLEGLVDEKFIDRSKDKTPSMGGILIVVSIIVSTLLWGNLENFLVLIFLMTLISFSLLGFADDYAKVAHKNRDGMQARFKFVFQIAIAFLALLAFHMLPQTGNMLQQFTVPFYKDPLFMMPLWSALGFGVIVVVSSSNAVNLTDGKDGLAVGCTIFCTLAYAAFAYMTGHKIFADHLSINYIPGSSEVVVFAFSIAGACIGFLWYNCHPASMFMGDTGSLALGGCIGLIAVLVKQEILLVLIGWVFVMEAGSVVLQVASMKIRKKRIFLCSPIHHHFEQKGWKETQIVTRFWIIAGVCALLGLATLKLR